MIPRTFPSSVAFNGSTQMIVYFLPSVTGLTRWVDYIPVKFTTVNSALTENTYNQNGYIPVLSIPSKAGLTPFKEYVPVFLDSSATDDDVWDVSITGFIPVGTAGVGGASLYIDFAASTSLDPRITFTRASTATYFNSAGVLTTTGFNLLTYSEQFDNSSVVKVGLNVAANTATAPDGTMTADVVSRSADGTANRNTRFNFTTTQTGTYTFSQYCKPDGATNRVALRLQDNAAVGGHCLFELVGDGSIVSSSGAVGTIEKQGDWYRVSVTVSLTGSFIAIQCLTFLGAYGSSTDPTPFSFWGAQLEAGSAATVYIPTTSATSGAARFDYDPVTLAPKGLLIEESRTNLLLYSTDLSTGWTKGTAATWTLNAATAPDGTMTALQGNEVAGFSISGTGGAVYRLGNTVSGSTAYTFSVYVRTQTGTATNVRLRLNETGGNNTLSSDLTVTTAWTRLSLTVTTAAGATAMSTLVGTGSGTADLYIWGAQLEAGAFATSYIPTVASQVTRAADLAVMTGTNFSSWYNQSEGTFFVSSDYTLVVGGNYRFDVTDGTSSNQMRLRSAPSGSTQSRFELTTSGVAQTTLSPATTNPALNKDAIAYKLDDAAAVVNAGTAGVDTSLTPATMNQMAIGATRLGASPINGHIQRIAYYNRRLTNAELQGITA